jgi:hypothetical protein
MRRSSWGERRWTGSGRPERGQDRPAEGVDAPAPEAGDAPQAVEVGRRVEREGVDEPLREEDAGIEP